MRQNTTTKHTEMNRKQFLKRLGLLTISAPAILADNLQSQPATTKSVERMRIGSNGDSYYYKIY